MLQIEVETNHISKIVFVSEALSSQDGYVNDAFEDVTQKVEKVNDKHIARIIVSAYYIS